jgi:hypothetical protein
MLGHRRLGPKIADSKSQIADSKSGPKEQVTLKDCSLHLLERKKPEYQRNRTRLLKRRDQGLRTKWRHLPGVRFVNETIQGEVYRMAK